MFNNELKILKLLNHNNIINLFESYENEESYCMVFEYLEGGDLGQVEIENEMHEENVITIMKAVLNGLVYLHEKNIIHRDIKPENILLRKNEITIENICIADFGLAEIITNNLFLIDKCGTPGYIAPEIFNKNVKYNEKCDIFTMSLLRNMLEYNPANRISAKEALNHELFTCKSIFVYESKEVDKDFKTLMSKITLEDIEIIKNIKMQNSENTDSLDKKYNDYLKNSTLHFEKPNLKQYSSDNLQSPLKSEGTFDKFFFNSIDSIQKIEESSVGSRYKIKNYVSNKSTQNNIFSVYESSCNSEKESNINNEFVKLGSKVNMDLSFEFDVELPKDNIEEY